MKNVTPMTEQFQHFVEEIREDFWGDVYQKGQEALKKFFESDSERQRDRYLGWGVPTELRTGARLPQWIL
jgi:hypothetical protein